MKILIFGDTHSHLDESLLPWMEKADEIWHTGDIGNSDLALKLSTYKTFRAVYGNIDGALIRKMFPKEILFQLEGFNIFMTHIGGYPGKYSTGIKEKLIHFKPDIFICGHSHILKVMRDENLYNLLYLNPGAMGKEGFHLVKTALWLEIENKKIKSLEVIEFGKRGEL